MQPHGIGLHANVVKECGEEAGIAPDLATTAKACGAVSYESWREAGLKREVLFVFDLELPDSFVPTAQDGEVQEFELMPVDRVMELVRDTDEFKDNCNLVLIDFFVRHGLIPADAIGYLKLVSGLRAGDCS
jgi:8-oxo-dGTP pyrophosphatase MutT (NUDIX family)